MSIRAEILKLKKQKVTLHNLCLEGSLAYASYQAQAEKIDHELKKLQAKLPPLKKTARQLRRIEGDQILKGIPPEEKNE
jgi:hypothetical protein